jgi:hypothetical protein
MNLFIGMCRGVAGLPRDLKNLGYMDRWIEYKFANSEDRTVAPELIISSGLQRHAVLFEWKEGANADPDQLNRYSKVTSEDLRSRVSLPSPEHENHDIALVGTEGHRERIGMTVERDGHPFPVLIVVADGLEIIMNRFSPEALDGIFRPKLLVQWARVPTSFFPVDRGSKEWEFAELVIPEIVRLMHQGESKIRFAQLAERVVPCWGNVDSNYRHELRLKILAVMSRAAQNEFRRYLTRNKLAEGRTHTETWDIVFNPFSAGGRTHRAELAKMRRLQASLIESLRTGKPNPMQGELF